MLQKSLVLSQKQLSSCQETVISTILKEIHRTILMKYSHLSLDNHIENTHLSLDHINTGTGREDSAQEHAKSDINPLHNKREDKAAILEHSLKARDLIM